MSNDNNIVEKPFIWPTNSGRILVKEIQTVGDDTVVYGTDDNQVRIGTVVKKSELAVLRGRQKLEVTGPLVQTEKGKIG
ncbi:MAG: hypothetical protein WAV41_01100 [Microgenomates group bacterium]